MKMQCNNTLDIQSLELQNNRAAKNDYSEFLLISLGLIGTHKLGDHQPPKRPLGLQKASQKTTQNMDD